MVDVRLRQAAGSTARRPAGWPTAAGTRRGRQARFEGQAGAGRAWARGLVAQRSPGAAGRGWGARGAVWRRFRLSARNVPRALRLPHRLPGRRFARQAWQGRWQGRKAHFRLPRPQTHPRFVRVALGCLRALLHVRHGGGLAWCWADWRVPNRFGSAQGQGGWWVTEFLRVGVE